MSENVRYQFWILVAAAIIFFTYLGAASLWDEDETLYASCAREMMDRGDWVVPWFNGRMFPDKPPLMFWLMMAGFELFGQNEFGARFFSAVLGVGTALLAYHLGRMLFNARVGFWAGLITASSIIFTVSARAATVDTALTFVTTMAMLCFIAALRVQGNAEGRRQNAELRVEKNKFCVHLFVLFYLCLGVAILAKGPVGFLLPMAAAGLFLMIVNSRRGADEAESTYFVSGWKAGCNSVLRVFRPMNFLRSLWQLRPITGLIVVLAVSLPWFYLVGARTNGLWLEQFFAKFNLRPFTQPILGHSGPVWYYIPAVLIGFFPWSVFLGPATIETIRRIRQPKGDIPIFADHCCATAPAKIGTVPRPDPWCDGLMLAACWFGIFFVFWSICSTKLPHYLLPAYPALALLTGCFLETWIAEPARVGPRWMKSAWITTVAAGLCIAVAVGVVARIYLPGEEMIGLIGFILVSGGSLCLYYGKRNHRQRAVMVFACTAVVFLTAMFGFAAQRVDRHQNAKRLLALIRNDSSVPAGICAYRFFRQSMVYYAGHPVVHCDSPEQLREFLEKSSRAYVITLDKYEAEIEEKHPGQFRLLARERRFLANDDMVVLAPAVPTDSSRTAIRPDLMDRQ